MRFFIISLTMLYSVSTAAIAEIYVGFGIGTANYKADLSTLGGGDLDEDGTGSKLYVGYSFSKYLAAEVNIYNFAEASVGALENDSGGYDSAAASMKGFGGYIVGMYPVSKQVNLMAKLGILGWDSDLTINDNSSENSGTDAALALAASYAFTKELLVTAEWEYFDIENPELSMLSLGFRFNFH